MQQLIEIEREQQHAQESAAMQEFINVAHSRGWTFSKFKEFIKELHPSTRDNDEDLWIDMFEDFASNVAVVGGIETINDWRKNHFHDEMKNNWIGLDEESEILEQFEEDETVWLKYTRKGVRYIALCRIAFDAKYKPVFALVSDFENYMYECNHEKLSVKKVDLDSVL